MTAQTTQCVQSSTPTAHDVITQDIAAWCNPQFFVDYTAQERIERIRELLFKAETALAEHGK